MKKDAKIYVAGNNGMVGSAIVKQLNIRGYTNILVRSHKELDLTDKFQVEEFFAKEKPEYVFLAAAKVGGIMANATYPVEFFLINSAIQNNVIEASHKNNIKKLLFLGSSCIYPKNTPQPIKEEYLLASQLEPTNEAYALAKISGLKLCEYYNKQYGTNYISCMPTNLYGENDNFDLETSHVLPALIRKFCEAKENNQDKVVVWGTGEVYREFLYVDDMADACIYLMENWEAEKGQLQYVNIGTGKEISIKNIALLISNLIDYKGKIEFDTSKPDGTKRKLLDISRLSSLGWEYKIDVEDGLSKSIKWYKENMNKISRK